MRCHTHQLIQMCRELILTYVPFLHSLAYQMKTNIYWMSIQTVKQFTFDIYIYWKESFDHYNISGFQGKNNKISPDVQTDLHINRLEEIENARKGKNESVIWYIMSMRWIRNDFQIIFMMMIFSVHCTWTYSNDFSLSLLNEQKRLFSLLNLIAYRQLLTCSFTVWIEIREREKSK